MSVEMGCVDRHERHIDAGCRKWWLIRVRSASIGRVDAREHLDESRLPGAVLTREAVDLTGLDLDDADVRLRLHLALCAHVALFSSDSEGPISKR